MIASERLSGIASMLFVPAGNARLLASALNRPADGFVLDLEDATPPDQKNAARQSLSADIMSLRKNGAQVGVPLNRPWTPLVPSLAAGVDFLMVPKVDTPQFVVAVAESLRELGTPSQVYVISQIGSAVAFGRLTDIAAAARERQAALMNGSEDWRSIWERNRLRKCWQSLLGGSLRRRAELTSCRSARPAPLQRSRIWPPAGSRWNLAGAWVSEPQWQFIPDRSMSSTPSSSPLPKPWRSRARSSLVMQKMAVNYSCTTAAWSMLPWSPGQDGRSRVPRRERTRADAKTKAARPSLDRL